MSIRTVIAWAIVLSPVAIYLNAFVREFVRGWREAREHDA
jgi:hypothetical protein